MEARSVLVNADGFRLDHKTAVVTGGASGIGRAIAETFAAHGATVHIVDMDAEKTRSAALHIVALSGRATAHICDTTGEGPVTELFDAIAGREPLDILVNSVGQAHVGTLETTSPQDFDRIFRVNVKSYFNC